MRGDESTVFPTAQVNPHPTKRLLYGLSPYSKVRFGADFCLYGAVRCGADLFPGILGCGFMKYNGTVLCCAV